MEDRRCGDGGGGGGGGGGGDMVVGMVILPQGAIMNAWSTRWNMGWFVFPPLKSLTLYPRPPFAPSFRYAARGYAVIAVNFHGSTGFGQEFCDSIRGDWGGQPCVPSAVAA
jgi:hypothetical protein